MLRSSLVWAAVAACALATPSAPLLAQRMMLAATVQKDTPEVHPALKGLSPEEKMAKRFPQPIRVGDLVGLPLLDHRNSTLGFIRQVVRTPADRIVLVVPYRAWLGWTPFDWGKRTVGVPLEMVAILGRQVAALDMSSQDFADAPTFDGALATPVSPDDTIRIAITRR